jgi:hypothetical protein
MATESALTRDARQRMTLDRLFAEAGLGQCATFFETGEGRFLPDGLEAMTGYVINATGQAYWFVLDWDPEQDAPTLADLRDVDPKPSWKHLAEYRQAREQVGLDND